MRHEGLVLRTSCQEELAARAETYYSNKHNSHRQDWQMEELLLQSREALDVKENLLCPGAFHASLQGQSP